MKQSLRQHAACRGVDPDIFYPPLDDGDDVQAVEAARAVCERCSVRQPCLEFALANRERDGIWGGATERERRRILRRRRTSA